MFVSLFATDQRKKIIENFNSVGAEAHNAHNVGKSSLFLAQL